MTNARIELKFGQFSFAGEGSENWVREQLEFALSKVPPLTSISEVAERPSDSKGDSNSRTPQQVGSLASHIRAKGGESNQTARFLATADWLRLRGERNLTTTLVAKALKDNHQSRLGNPADALNKNVAKGFCEKTENGFFITPEGLRSLGA